MPSASAPVRTSRHKTERLNLQAVPVPQREDGAVATVRILNVGSKTAARSGSTWQIPGPVQPGQPIPDPPHVIYARPARVVPPPPQQQQLYEPPAPAGFAHDERSLFDTPRQRIAELRVRASRALSGLSADTQRMDAGAWSKPSTRVMTLAVAIYALALFLFALFSR
ncbi:MAG TPA: hypothetical protein VFN67_18630 [Polyangiales bacterium]|nr:hypothetical protein [Polyangiales bacterium]